MYLGIYTILIMVSTLFGFMMNSRFDKYALLCFAAFFAITVLLCSALTILEALYTRRKHVSRGSG